MATTFWQQGNTDTKLAYTVTTTTGTIVDLTGLMNSAITPRLKRTDVPDTFWPIAGSVTIGGTPSNGQISITFAAADVATPGNYSLDCQVHRGTNDDLYTPPTPFSITSA